MGDVIHGWKDRYNERYPNPETICLGPCDGMGCFPVNRNNKKADYKRLWDEAEKEKPSDDGWHIVRCPDCEGTGKNKNGKSD